ncbi:MAG: hypothetical protein V1820_02040 [archaeon]
MKIPVALPAAFLLILLLSASVFSAEISGGAYSWEDLSLASPVVFSINTTPEQTLVSESGKYSFFVPEGIYLLKAESFRGAEKLLEDSSTIKVLDDGSPYRIDFILFPAVPSGGNLDEEQSPSIDIQIVPRQATPNLFIIPLLIGAGAGGAFYIYFRFLRKKPAAGRKKATSRELAARPVQTPKKNLDPELAEILEKISAAGGRIIQRELRREMPYSEAKASLLLSELEARGLVRKYKRGRANLIVLANSKKLKKTGE